VGFLPVFFPPEGSFGHAPVDALPVPVDAEHVVVLAQGGLPEFAEHAARLPALEVAVQAAARTELGRDGFPVTSRAQNIEDAVENLAVRQAWTPTFGGSSRPWQERFDPLPQGIRNAEVGGDLRS
jgi:hypothetical protein